METFVQTATTIIALALTVGIYLFAGVRGLIVACLMLVLFCIWHRIIHGVDISDVR